MRKATLSIGEERMAQNQETVAGPIKMDSRKFLGALNDSVQSKITFYENKVSEMGKAAGKNWQLASFKIKQINRNQQYSGELFIEDVDTHDYFIADCKREKGGKITIENICPLVVMEEEKQQLFEQNCYKLVESIEANDQKGMGAAFNKMSAQRFSGRAIPHSGMVKTKDGITRYIKIANDNSIDEDVRPQIISAIVATLRDKVVVENGSIVSGEFNDGEKIKLPVTKWAARKLIGKQMREAAQEAYWSPGFQNRVYDVSKLVYVDNIEEAVKSISPFLNENEEFTLLNRNQIQTLIENALASKACFNQQLCNDVATLFHRTNLKINKDVIVKEWANIAKKVEHPTLMENVHILSESKNFEAAYDKFLELIFEAVSNRDVTAEALATTLQVLKDKTPKIKESHSMSSKLNDLIERLKDPEFDDSAIYEAEDLIATVQEELTATEGLSDFDVMPGEDSMPEDLGDEDLDAENTAAPIININAPLISIGSSNVSGGEEEDFDGLDGLDDLGDDEDLGEEEDESLADLLGGEEDLGDGDEDEGDLDDLDEEESPFESRRSRKSVNEGGLPAHLEKHKFGSKNDSDDDSDDDDSDDSDDDEKASGKPWEESRDPYAFNDNASIDMSDYGATVIEDSSDVSKIIKIMGRLAEEHGLKGEALAENLEDLAKASIEAVGLRIPSNKMGPAVDEVIRNFSEGHDLYDDLSDEELDGAPDQEQSTKMDNLLSTEPEDDPEDDGLDENQYKDGTRRRKMGMQRSSITPTESVDYEVQWIEEQVDGSLGQFNGVNFILDHGGSDSQLAPVILSEDGTVEVPLPEEVRDSAFASVGLSDGHEGTFVEWLSANIEQLRPISEEENKALSEAVATITANADGSISVEVDSDVEVDLGVEVDGDIDSDIGEFPDDAGMEPVDSIIPPGEVGEVGEVEEGPMDLAADEMPDFENMDEEEVEDVEDEGDEGDEEFVDDDEEFVDGEDEEDEEGFAEDKDMTEPKNSKYTKVANSDKRESPKVKMPKSNSDKLDGIGPKVKKDDGSGTNPPKAK